MLLRMFEQTAVVSIFELFFKFIIIISPHIPALCVADVWELILHYITNQAMC